MRLGVKRPFMLTPQAVHHDDSLVLRWGRWDSVDVCCQNDMASTPVTSRSPAGVQIGGRLIGHYDEILEVQGAKGRERG